MDDNHTVRIRKIDDIHFHFILHDDGRQIDEQVTGAQLQAMLKRETLINTRGETIAAGDILYVFDNEKPGHELTFTLVPSL